MVAHLMFGEGLPRCPACVRGGESLRRTWGCDRAAPAPIFSMTCPRCSGHDADCPEPDFDLETGANRGGCGGMGEVHVYRCPASQVTQDAAEVARAYAHYESSGVLPDPGGLWDQAASLIDAFDIIGAERALLEEERMSRARSPKGKGV